MGPLDASADEADLEARLYTAGSKLTTSSKGPALHAFNYRRGLASCDVQDLAH